MPESRDRIPRPVADLFALRRTAGVGVLLDDQGMSPSLFGSPIMRVSTVTTPVTRGRTALGATRSGGLGRCRSGTPRNVRGWNLSQASGRDIAQSSRRWSGRGMHGNSMLPFWYPRTPLRDITAVVRAIERRSARLRDVEGQQIESPVPEGQRVLDPSVPESSAQLEHNLSLTSPNPAFGVKPCTPSVGKVPKILLKIANENTGESEFVTPQKKLLNSIDTVEKVVMEELQKLKRTPSAKQVEREKRVRTLRCMR
ncbi:protein POLYCHOME-like [Juglans microcarpa x Juglans regia]|uniref:protein POLYCHOME-like n=1 Tax=Juglans microcarpa x Juglans regia TaxID=2249226 RepID=UPI001B7F343B|nr:protein POLYCHOME-like [Juglans microcarpa x Juglans regia]